MKKILLIATTLILMTGISKAAKDEAATKTNNAASYDNNAPATVTSAVATSSTISINDLLKENQALKAALAKATAEKETLASQLDFAHNMHFSVTSLYEMQLQKQEEDAKNQAAFDWMMHTVITNLKDLVSKK